MKITLVISTFFIYVISYCQDSAKTQWQNDFHLTHNIEKDSIWFQPVKFYLEDKNCSSVAKEFYYGNYRPTDDDKTEKLLNLTVTNDKNLRPFYRWILDKTIIIQDGALAEYTGGPARKYAESYPKEFFEFMDSDKTKQRYSNWTNSILYSGFYKTDDFNNPKKIRDQLIRAMNENCKTCSEKLKKRIKIFAQDCFPNK